MASRAGAVLHRLRYLNFELVYGSFFVCGLGVAMAMLYFLCGSRAVCRFPNRTGTATPDTEPSRPIVVRTNLRLSIFHRLKRVRS